MTLTWANLQVTMPRKMARVHKLVLEKALDDHIRRGHPWIYRRALAKHAPLPSGTVVELFNTDNGWLGRGLYDATSPLAVRIFTREPEVAIDRTLFASRIQSALRLRRQTLDLDATNAFRWLHGESDFVPGLVADVYDHVAVFTIDSDALSGHKATIAQLLLETGRAVGIDRVYFRHSAGKGESLLGGPPPTHIEIFENGWKFEVDVVSGQKTGFFLDQRDNRRFVSHLACGPRAVNVFGYTGAFSLSALRAGATRVTTVDSARPAIAAAERHFAINDAAPSQHEFVCEDAFAWMKRMIEKRTVFDLVIVDPPSFAPSERALAQAQEAYARLHHLALQLVAANGLLATASCSSHVTMPLFLSYIAEGAARAGRNIHTLAWRGQPADHPVLPGFPESNYLKFVLVHGLSS